MVTIEKTLASSKKRKASSSKPKAEKGDSVKQTLELIKADHDMEDICAMRGLAESTIWSHIFQIHALHP
ncbi:helix-turn-helix domain-containing protein [Patescibacteria group bacterium]|nr:helix-turn-helix domain-containing protein [Patescibacteria group bacterium]